jgi:hypothetical protein
MMAMPNQSLWRLFAEIILRLPVNHPSGHDSEGNGRGRLWVHIDPDNNDSEARYVMYMKGISFTKWKLKPVFNYDLQ